MKNQRGEVVFDKRLSPSTDRIVLECCQRAKELEAAGDYEAARDALAGRWRGVGHSPSLDGLGTEAAAALLLRAGALNGWLGSAQQIPGGQETAKDFITESVRLFESSGDDLKAAEARMELALCYWREGAFDEARVTLRGVLESLDESDPELRARALLRAVTVERSARRLRAALRLLNDESPLFLSLKDDYLKGCFFSIRGITYKDLLETDDVQEEGGVPECVDRALMDCTAACIHFESVGHVRYQGRNENNVGHLKMLTGRYAEAHERLNYARGLFAGLKDRGSIAEVDETRARVFIAEGCFDKAEEVVAHSIAVLEQGGQHALLAAALTTSGIALARMGRYAEAKARLLRAIDVAETAGATQSAAHAALTFIEELHHQLSGEEVCDAYETADRLAGPEAITQTLLRMRDSAKLLSDLFRRLIAPRLPCDLNKEVRLLERRHIEEALRASNGRITCASKLLGFKHPQSLNSIMQSRHKDILDARLPPVRRRRSLLKSGR